MAYLKTLSTFGGEEIHDLSMVINTQMVFMQQEAPLGWTRRTDLNDVGLRVVSGDFGVQINAGVRTFSNVFASTVDITGIIKSSTPTADITETSTTSLSGTITPTIDSHIVSISETPTHSHSFGTNGHKHTYVDQVYPALYGGSCFTPETLVLMSDGTEKQIKDIMVGDRVISHDKTSINTVVFIEHQPNSSGLWAPYNGTPFATPNHPLFIEGKLSSPDDKDYCWLGDINIIDAPINRDRDGEEVFNLWVTGDGTYIVNGYGTHSIIWDGGFLRLGYEQGYLTYDEVITAVRHLAQIGPIVVNRFLGWLNFKPFTKFCASGITAPDTHITSRVMRFIFRAIGNIHKIFR